MSKSAAKKEDEFGQPRNAEDAEWQELLLRQDRVGIRYWRAAQLRQKRKLNTAERSFLKEFDAARKKIWRDPQSVLETAFDAIYRGLTLIETLIHEKRAQNISESEDAALSEAVSTLSLLAADLRVDIIRYAEEGMPWACHAIFREGKAMASAFSRLAIACPEHFQPYAEHSLTMPSLRARNSNFTCDAETIIAAVHLAEKHHASNLHDNRTRIGALCHQFVAEMVDLLVACRLEAKEKGDTDSKWFHLPELNGNAKAWWKAEFKEWVQREYERMKKNPRRNPALWQELEKVTDHGTDSAKRAALEKYCFNKLEQIAGAPPSPASPA